MKSTAQYILHTPCYQIGDILQVTTEEGDDQYILIEDTDEYVYRYRNLTVGNLAVQSIFYLDNNNNVSKVA